MRPDEFPRVVPEDRLMTVAEVATYFSVCERTIRRWAKLGILPAVRLGAPDPASRRPRLMVRFRFGDVARLASASERRGG